MNIGLDMMGGDFSPLEVVKGVQLYLREFPSKAILWLVGDEEQVRPLVAGQGIPAEAVRIVHAPQVIEMNEHPTRALKEKQQSSIAIGFHLLATGKMDAFISAGNTGAMLVGAHYFLIDRGDPAAHDFHRPSQREWRNRRPAGCGSQC